MEQKKLILNFKGSNPLKTISINQHLKKQPMNENEINNQERVMSRGQSPFYKFTTHNHFEIIDILDKHRVFHKIKKVDFSKMAGLTQTHFGNLSNYSSRFSVRSYAKYRNLINTLNAEIEAKENEKNYLAVSQPKPVYAPTESKPVYAPVESNSKPIYIPNPNQSHLKITLEMVKMFLNSNNGEEICINFLKSLGKYKISKSEVTTNWIEL